MEAINSLYARKLSDIVDEVVGDYFENLPEESLQMFIATSITPVQGLDQEDEFWSVTVESHLEKDGKAVTKNYYFTTGFNEEDVLRRPEGPRLSVRAELEQGEIESHEYIISIGISGYNRSEMAGDFEEQVSRELWEKSNEAAVLPPVNSEFDQPAYRVELYLDDLEDI